MNAPTTSNKPPGVFLSHSWADKRFARRLAQDLTAAGARVWFDEAQLQVGDSIIERLRQAIDDMEFVAVVLSPNSVDSGWVRKEVDVAMHHEIEGKRVKVLPLLYKRCELPDFLKGKLYVDFTRPGSYRQGVAKLLNRLGLVERLLHPRGVEEVGVVDEVQPAGHAYSTEQVYSTELMMTLEALLQRAETIGNLISRVEWLGEVGAIIQSIDPHGHYTDSVGPYALFARAANWYRPQDRDLSQEGQVALSFAAGRAALRRILKTRPAPEPPYKEAVRRREGR